MSAKEGKTKVLILFFPKKINSLKKYGCLQCVNKRRQLSFDDVFGVGQARGLDLVSFKDPNKPLTKSEFNELAERFLKNHPGKSLVNIKLRWKHKDEACGEIFDNLYVNIRNGRSYCPVCASHRNEYITYKIFKYLFKRHLKSGEIFHSRYPLDNFVPKKILYQKKYSQLTHQNVHVDMFVVLKIGGIGGREIKLAIEYQGEQHDPDPKIGFRALYGMSGYRATKKEWLELLERDEQKVKLFNELNKEDYYLIKVNYDMDPKDRFEFIAKDFKGQTGISISYKEVSDWRIIAYGSKI